MHSSITIDMMQTISFEMGGLTFDARNELRLQLPDPLASHQANEYDSPDPNHLQFIIVLDGFPHIPTTVAVKFYCQSPGTFPKPHVYVRLLLRYWAG